ncbi:Small auxin-up RNA - like 10 [Theobroma cacao]|nr:Small auxin-up RNA - like 10 [Theobroma cacao]
MARNWQKKAAIGRKRITSNMMASKKPSVVDKGHFVIYTTDKRSFAIPLVYLSNSIFLKLLKMSEEDFRLSSDGPITLPCDSLVMNYIILLIQRVKIEGIECCALAKEGKLQRTSNMMYYSPSTLLSK